MPDDQSDRQSILDKWKDKTKEEILEAKVNSDLFIKTKNAQFDDLKKDYLQLREQQQASADLKTIIDQMKSKNDDTTHNTQGENQQPAIKPEDIEALMETRLNEKLNQRDLVTKQRENFSVVERKLKEQYGNDYHSVYQKKLEELNLSKDFADDLAKNHPNLFIKTFDLEPKVNQPQVLPRSSTRNTSFAPTTLKRDWNYYQEMKKVNPKLYLDPKIAIQMHDDAIALGPDFGMPD
jgi:hypothetical protein